MRFCRQPAWYSCGPTAIINAAKWAGLRCQVRVYHSAIAKLCKSDYTFGTDKGPFEKTLRLFLRDRACVRARCNPTFASIVGHTRKCDGAVVLFYWRKSHDYSIAGHYVLVLPYDDENVLFINDVKNVTTTVVTHEELKQKLSLLRKKKDGPKAWFLRKI